MSAQVQRELDRRYREWLDFIEANPEIRLKSRRADYIENEPYRRIVALGGPALAYLMDKLAMGEFRLLPAAMQLAGVTTDRIMQTPDGFHSDQEIALALLKWWRPRRRIPWFILPVVNIFWR